MLYLDNDFHAAHHEPPGFPWYGIARQYRTDRHRTLQRNGGFLVPGYGGLMRRCALTPVDSPVHPTLPS